MAQSTYGIKFVFEKLERPVLDANNIFHCNIFYLLCLIALQCRLIKNRHCPTCCGPLFSYSSDPQSKNARDY